MKNTLEIISQTQLFKGLPEDQLKEIQKIAEVIDFNKGKIIFLEKDKVTGFYVVASGKIKISKISMEGKEKILHIFGPGEPFGEVPVFTGQPYPANAEAISKTRLIFFQKEAFINLISNNPFLSLNMLGVLSKRLRQFTIHVENLSLKEVPGRIAAYLVLLSEEQENNDMVMLDVSKGHLASLLGTIPETLSRIFSKMKNRNMIEVNGRNIKLLDLNGLKELAEHGKI